MQMLITRVEFDLIG